MEARCPCCTAGGFTGAGSRHPQPDGRIRHTQAEGRRRLRAWVSCGSCGWGWWTVHRGLVQLAAQKARVQGYPIQPNYTADLPGDRRRVAVRELKDAI